MQRVLEIQSNWDEREKLRHFAMRIPAVPNLGGAGMYKYDI